jgi:hypothetical protein
VLDLFSGSGTTLVAAEQCSRRGFATELDPRYVDVGVLRWEGFTGREARLASTGKTFREVRAERQAAASQAIQAPIPVALPEPRVRVRVRPVPLAA